MELADFILLVMMIHTSKWSRKRRARNLVSSRKKEDPNRQKKRDSYSKEFDEITGDSNDLVHRSHTKKTPQYTICLNEKKVDDTPVNVIALGRDAASIDSILCKSRTKSAGKL
jgi:hypothetical protein